MKVYMIQAFFKESFYKVVHGDLTAVHPVTILPELYLSKEEALSALFNIIKTSDTYECPIIIEKEL